MYLHAALVGLVLQLHFGATHKLVCYISSWSSQGMAQFKVDHVDPFLCTHLVVTFTDINGSYELEPHDHQLYHSFNRLKLRNPKLKTLLATGGQHFNGTLFSQMISIKAHRTAFIHSVLKVVRTFGFDGLDLVQKYPYVFPRGLKDEAKFTSLARELRLAFDRESSRSGKRRLVLSTTLSPWEQMAGSDFHKYVDFISLMSYDLHGPWQGVTGHSSPLYSGGTSQNDLYLNINQMVKYWLYRKIPARKLLLGFAVYSRTFELQGREHGMGAPAKEGGPGKYTKTTGFMALFEVCQFIESGATVKWSKNQQVPYAYKGKQWLGFENQHSLRKKVKWLTHLDLGGAMVWSLDLDDFTGTSCHQGKYPFIKQLKSSLLAQRKK
ncbi:acidic mammalian chitinase-like [Polypterus senegalus]|uniref:acidic mammalian chitinase-like n=1 Tax=Polypterus senegalus TaxID=55291 RepID=UPI0019662918|nr:acidic mammalian chitinase-like [Polypterus senegalus]